MTQYFKTQRVIMRKKIIELLADLKRVRSEKLRKWNFSIKLL